MSINTPSDSEETVDNKIGKESNRESWFMVRSNSVGDSDILQLKLQEFEECLSLSNVFEDLSTVGEKLAFFDKNRNFFEFPYCTITLCNEIRVYFIFDFLPNKEEAEEVRCYNEWFILNSRKLLKKYEVALKGLPIIGKEELIKSFDLKKNRIQLLDDFVKYESESVKSLCEQAFPNRFETLYSLAVREVQIDISTKIIGPNIWPDLFIWPYVMYIYELKKYSLNKSNEQQQQLIQAIRDLKALPEKPQPRNERQKKEDPTLLDLFKNNKAKLETFINILKKHDFLDAKDRWCNHIQPNDLLPLIDCIEKGLIKKVNRTMLKRILEKAFGPVMSERSFRNKDYFSILDEDLEKELSSLIQH